MQTVRLLIPLVMLTLTMSGTAAAVTPDELAALAKAGLGDDVLIALIDSTGVNLAVDATRSLALKRAGVSDRVIAAAVRASYRETAQAPAIDEPLTAAPCAQCEDNVAVMGGTPPVTVVEREIYYLPWIVGVPARRGHSSPSAPYLANKGFGRFINDGFVERKTGRR